jgi:hypothetical protein
MSMAERVCDVCGKKKDLKQGRTCETGHFVCAGCKWISGFFLARERRVCPVCEKRLR